jgi:alpha-tubulin suppressor-like RCC1 family protein
VESQCVPRRVESLVGKKIVEMSAGGAHSMTLLEQGHSLFLSNEGKCYACGGGLMGQTGLGTASDVLRPHRVYLQKRILHVSAGGMHSIFVTDVGETFTCGHGKFGQLGHGDRQNQDAPERILSLAKERIVQASAGAFFSLFLAGMLFPYQVLSIRFQAMN